jgi:hypothetical protein
MPLWDALVVAHGVDALLQQILVPEDRQVVQDRVVGGEHHVVRQARAGQGDGHVMDQLAGLIDHAVVHVGRVFGVVEEQQFSGGLVDLGVGRDAVQRPPARDAALFQGLRIQPVGLAALIEGRDDLAGVDHHIG